MYRVRSFEWLALLVFACGICGCGGSDTQYQELTPAQIEQQRAEDKIDLEAEDKAEAEFQKKRQKQ
jgi:hypothetical protein